MEWWRKPVRMMRFDYALETRLDEALTHMRNILGFLLKNEEYYTGKGRTVYFSSLAEDFYTRYRMPDVSRIYADCVRLTMGRPQAVEVDAPETVQFEVREQRSTGRILVHFVNTTGDMQRPISSLALYPCPLLLEFLEGLFKLIEGRLSRWFSLCASISSSTQIVKQ